MTEETGQAVPRRRPPQMSIGFMLLMTLVFAAMCAALYRASRVPAVVRDAYAAVGWEVPSSDTEIERTLHVYFLLFTYTTPLILAGVLSTIWNVYKWIAHVLAKRSAQSSGGFAASPQPSPPSTESPPSSNSFIDPFAKRESSS